MEEGKAAVLSDTVVKVIGKREFVVKRYFTGNKNIDEVLTRIAVSKVYEEKRSGLINKNSEKYSLRDLAKREAI